MLNWIERLARLLRRSKDANHQGREWYRPMIQQLEDRTVLDAFLWVGGMGGPRVSAAWSEPANWFDETTNKAAKRAPGNDAQAKITDTVTFTGNRNSVTVDTKDPVTVNELKVVDDYTGHITLNQSLRVEKKASLMPLDGGNSFVMIDGPKDLVLLTGSVTEWFNGTMAGTGSLIVNFGAKLFDNPGNPRAKNKDTLAGRSLLNQGTIEFTFATLSITKNAVFTNEWRADFTNAALEVKDVTSFASANVINRDRLNLLGTSRLDIYSGRVVNSAKGKLTVEPQSTIRFGDARLVNAGELKLQTDDKSSASVVRLVVQEGDPPPPIDLGEDAVFLNKSRIVLASSAFLGRTPIPVTISVEFNNIGGKVDFTKGIGELTPVLTLLGGGTSSKCSYDTQTIFAADRDPKAHDYVWKQGTSFPLTSSSAVIDGGSVTIAPRGQRPGRSAHPTGTRRDYWVWQHQHRESDLGEWVDVWQRYDHRDSEVGHGRGSEQRHDAGGPPRPPVHRQGRHQLARLRQRRHFVPDQPWRRVREFCRFRHPRRLQHRRRRDGHLHDDEG